MVCIHMICIYIEIHIHPTLWVSNPTSWRNFSASILRYTTVKPLYSNPFRISARHHPKVHCHETCILKLILHFCVARSRRYFTVKPVYPNWFREWFSHWNPRKPETTILETHKPETKTAGFEACNPQTRTFWNVKIQNSESRKLWNLKSDHMKVWSNKFGILNFQTP